MITSITFPKKGIGYIYQKPVKPKKPEQKEFMHTDWDSEDYHQVLDQEKWDKAMQEYQMKLEFYQKNHGKFINTAAKNLIGKTFTFDRDRINILFGPNGSGKTTILKALAGNALIDDGFPNLKEPGEMFGWSSHSLSDEQRIQKMDAYRLRKQGNECTIDWDGETIYYNNFGFTRNHGGFEIGGMVGTLFQDITEEISYTLGKESISAGQMSSFLFNKLYRNMKNIPTVKELLSNQKYQDCNDVWVNSYNYQRTYFFEGLPGYDKKDKPTLLIDEIDKSLDIETVWKLCRVVLPRIRQETGVQIIAISHSPLILTKEIRENKLFNFIPVDKQYTKKMVGMLNGVSFG